jgi:hypothetical protein
MCRRQLPSYRCLGFSIKDNLVFPQLQTARKANDSNLQPPSMNEGQLVSFDNPKETYLTVQHPGIQN